MRQHAVTSLDPIYVKNKKFNTLKDCEPYFSKGLIKQIKRAVRRNYDTYIARYAKRYNQQIQERATGLPEINPTVTLSCSGFAKILGRNSTTTGYYQQNTLRNLGLLDIEYNRHLKINDNSRAILERSYGLRSDTFNYIYPTRKTLSGKFRGHFLKLPNILKPIENTIFF